MTLSKVFNTVILCLVVSVSFAQYQLTGTVRFKKDSTIAKDCRIILNAGSPSTTTDEKGNFRFRNLPVGTYKIQTSLPDYQSSQQEISITDKDVSLTIYLDLLNATLNEVVVKDKQSDFGFTRMRAVESMGIYEGKKTEVILPEQLVANLATNNARQVYARVAGLNIWENDGAGLQLSIGGRGLDPNRSSNFNVRQNG